MRDDFPECTALIDELKAACPELFEGAKTIYMAENGKEATTRVYRSVQDMSQMSCDQYLAFGELSKRNTAFVNKEY